MKSQNPGTSTENIPRSILQLNVPEESRRNGPSLAQIRERAFEIHIERGGIHGCDLDDWLLAERELQEKYKKSNDGGPKKK
jgi:Protein of unknown function (DUF2934)